MVYYIKKNHICIYERLRSEKDRSYIEDLSRNSVFFGIVGNPPSVIFISKLIQAFINIHLTGTCFFFFFFFSKNNSIFCEHITELQAATVPGQRTGVDSFIGPK